MRYLLDRRTNVVYRNTAEEQYPEAVGRYVGGGVQLSKNRTADDFFTTLDQYLKDQKVCGAVMRGSPRVRV